MPRRILRPFQSFLKHESSSGFILIISAIMAVLIANSEFAPVYEHLIHTEISLGFGSLSLSYSLVHWVNDGLMAVFFFVVGMEIKRELVIGELKSPKKAALPIGAAVGGMVVPAAVYTFFNYGTAGITGWGIPMATDIAFALAALSLLGSRKAPQGLAVFLTALAIVDDLGAILVIAVFYTTKISLTALFAAAVIFTALYLANMFSIRLVPVYILLGILLWLALLKSGIHATIAGVLLGMVIPVKSKKGEPDRMLSRLEHAVQPWVAFGIMPVFAFINAGVPLDFSRLGYLLADPVSIGIIAGLFLGKQAGIFGAAFLMIRFKLAALPARVNLRQLYGTSILGGIGFTMSIFIANLAFLDVKVLDTAKISIILASLVSATVGYGILSIQAKRKGRLGKEAD